MAYVRSLQVKPTEGTVLWLTAPNGTEVKVVNSGTWRGKYRSEEVYGDTKERLMSSLQRIENEHQEKQSKRKHRAKFEPVPASVIRDGEVLDVVVRGRDLRRSADRLGGFFTITLSDGSKDSVSARELCVADIDRETRVDLRNLYVAREAAKIADRQSVKDHTQSTGSLLKGEVLSADYDETLDSWSVEFDGQRIWGTSVNSVGAEVQAYVARRDYALVKTRGDDGPVVPTADATTEALQYGTLYVSQDAYDKVMAAEQAHEDADKAYSDAVRDLQMDPSDLGEEILSV